MDYTGQVAEHEQCLLQALRVADLEKLDELLHDQLLFQLPNGQIITKQADMETYRSGVIIIKSISSVEQKINIIEDTAIVSVSIELKGQYEGQSIDGNCQYLRVWKLFRGFWKVIAGSCTPV